MTNVGWLAGIAVLIAIGCSSNELRASNGDGRSEASTSISTTAADSCAAVNTTPIYKPSHSDTAAFETLIQGAGVAPAIATNWVGVAGGNLCGGSEPELAMLRTTGPTFSVVRGPAPYVVAQGSPVSITSWSGLAVGRLNPSESYDKIVAVRHKTDTSSDVAIITADPTTCVLSSQFAMNLGVTASNSQWVGAAIGNFDGTRKVVLLRSAPTNNVVVMHESGTALVLDHQETLDGSTTAWTGIAAGDLDHDGIDELVLMRMGGTGQNIFVYKYVSGLDAHFTKMASTSYHPGTAGPVAVTIGDFNGDGIKSIAVTRNSAPNFALFTYHASTITLLAENNLDSAPSGSGVFWRALAGVDLIPGFDQGTQELVAVRTIAAPYRTDTFVYGTSQNRTRRDKLLDNTRSQAYWTRPGNSQQGNIDRRHDTWTDTDIQTLINSLKDTHTNTYNWLLEYPHDYTGLISFLQATAVSNIANCVDGQQIRVWVTLVPPPGSTYVKALGDPCSRPESTFRNESQYFHEGIGDSADPDFCGQYIDPSGGWSALIGTLAVEFPNLVGVGFDDFSDFIAREDGSSEPTPSFNEQFLATFQSGIQSRAPWVSFVPTFYFESLSNVNIYADYGKLLTTYCFSFGTL